MMNTVISYFISRYLLVIQINFNYQTSITYIIIWHEENKYENGKKDRKHECFFHNINLLFVFFVASDTNNPCKFAI